MSAIPGIALFLGLAASFLAAHAQTNTGSSRGAASTGQPSAQTTSPPSDLKDEKEHQRLVFGLASFINEIGGEEAVTKREISEGQDPARHRINYVIVMGIRKNEQDIMRIILLDAFNRIKDIDTQYMESSDSSVRKSLQARKALIYDEVLNRLMQQLGKDEFAKVAAYILRTSPRRTANKAPQASAHAPQKRSDMN